MLVLDDLEDVRSRGRGVIMDTIWSMNAAGST